MATKPTNTPRWANSGGAIVEPSSGKKDVGFVAGERPPAQFLNWLLNLLYLWVAWLNDIVAPGSGSEALSISSAGTLAADGKHGDRLLVVHAAAGNGTNAGISAGNGYMAATGAGEWWLPIPIRVGDRIKTLNLWANDSIVGGQTVTVELVRFSSTGTRTSIAGPSPSSGAWAATAILSSLNHTVLTDNVYYARIAYSSSGLRFAGIQVTYDR